MAPSIQSALGGFVGSVAHLGHEIVNAFLALFGAFLAFGQAILSVFLQAGQAVLQLGTDLIQSVAGFVFGTFISARLKERAAEGRCSKLLHHRHHWRRLLLLYNASGWKWRQNDEEKVKRGSRYDYITRLMNCTCTCMPLSGDTPPVL